MRSLQVSAMVRLFLALWLAITPTFVWAGSMTLLGVGGPAAPSYTGPGDIVSGALTWGSCSRAYNAAYANGTNSLCDLKDKTTGTVAICTLRVKTNGFVDLTGTYCTGAATPATACAAAAGGACVVTKLYDQTGNGNHFTQTTLAQMPALNFSVVGGLPGIVFAGNQIMDLIGLTVAVPYSFSAVAERTTFVAATFAGILTGAGAPFLTFNNTANLIDWAPNGGDITIAANDNVFHAIQSTTTTGAHVVYVDGSSASGATTGAAGTLNFIIGGNSFAPSGALNGPIMEVGIWPSLFSAGNAGSLNTNQHGSANGYNF